MEHVATETPQKKFVRLAKKWRRPLGGAVLTIFFLGGAFYGGVTYQKHQTPTTKSNGAMRAASSFGQTGNGGGFGTGRGAGFQHSGRVIGQVTAVSSSSITVQATSGTSTTLAITSSTTITNDGQTASASSIAAGDTVFVTESTSNISQAARIMLNPSFSGQDMSQTNAQTQSD